MTMRRAKRYQNSAALLIFMRRTTIPNSSFLIPHSRKAFIHNQWTEPPKELTLGASIFYAHLHHFSLLTFHGMIKETLIKSQSPIWHVFSCNASS